MLTAAVLMGAACFASPASATVPHALTEQGRLLDSAGNPQTGVVSVRFALYDAPTSGAPLWTETQSVPLDVGYFSAQLGAVTPIPGSVWDGSTRYVGITVGSDAEMAPRQPTSSVPYALVADDAVGDLHPASVTVAGTLVIDAQGNWVGSGAGPVGPTGPQGAAGATGPAGPQGPAGAPGVAGATGPQGPIGPQGAVGATGPLGPQGPVGATGATGPQGSTGLQGPAGTTGATGPVGPMAAPGAVGNVLTSDGSNWISQAPAAGSGAVISGRNLLANGNFDLWQRAVTGGASAFVADRWRSGANVTSYSQQSASPPPGSYYFARFVASGAGTLARTRLEAIDIGRWAGQQVTLSFHAKAAAAGAVVTPSVATPTALDTYTAVTACASSCPTAQTLGTGWTQFTTTFTLPAATNLGMQLGFDVAGAATIDLAQIQLELGTAATRFEQQPLQHELARCQRYYEKSYDQGVTAGIATTSGQVCMRSVQNGNSYYPVFFKVTKRADPVVTVYSTLTGASGMVRNVDINVDNATQGGNPQPGQMNGVTVASSTSSNNAAVCFQYTVDAEL
jgi:hypothetical protein